MLRDKIEGLQLVVLDGLEKFTYTSYLLSSEEKEHLQCVLLRNIDVFVWNHSDMTRIDPMLASHKLNIIPVAKLVRQKVRRFHQNRHQIIQAKVDNLLRTCFIKRCEIPRMASQCGGGSKEER